ncbi:hypothetical protein HUO13_26515 [Saccharopolyspora erythraea]|nr:hypothetical protein HUO13_26515 [Saccharopolyspora erythraea]
MKVTTWGAGDTVGNHAGWLWTRPILRWRSGRRLRELGIPRRFRMEHLRGALERRLGKPIFFGVVDLPASAPSGLVLTTGEAILVVADAQLRTSHRWHVWLHELMHLVWGHVGTPEPDSMGALRTMFPTLPDDVLEQVLSRTTCEHGHEIEAEMLAALCHVRMASWRAAEERQDMPAEVAAALQRFQDLLG